MSDKVLELLAKIVDTIDWMQQGCNDKDDVNRLYELLSEVRREIE